jgi:hypothetical protein
MNWPARPHHLAGAVIGAALLASALGGCDQRGRDQSGPVNPPVPAPSAGLSTGPAGSEGLTVRYLDADGKIQTVEVENFPR